MTVHQGQNKVFGIGFHKTGTKSLADALRILGYRVTGPNGQNDPRIPRNVYKIVDNLLDQYDAFQDNPWPMLYKELDRKCPESKFILTVRDTDQWFASMMDHFGAKSTPMREWIYGPGRGSPLGNEDIYRKTYESHNNDVITYFRERPNDLLIIDITDENPWAKLCEFLGKDIPKTPFPHSNSADNRIEGRERPSILAWLRGKLPFRID